MTVIFHEETIDWIYACLFMDDNISDMIFSCFSLYPSQHLHFCCVYLVLLTFSYRPTFPNIFIAGLLAIFKILFSNTSGSFLSQMTPDISRHLFHPALIIFVTSFSHPPSACMIEPK